MPQSPRRSAKNASCLPPASSVIARRPLPPEFACEFGNLMFQARQGELGGDPVLHPRGVCGHLDCDGPLPLLNDGGEFCGRLRRLRPCQALDRESHRSALGCQIGGNLLKIPATAAFIRFKLHRMRREGGGGSLWEDLGPNSTLQDAACGLFHERPGFEPVDCRQWR